MTDEMLSKVRELSRVKAQIARLNEHKRELEAYFLERGGFDVADTKYKSATYSDPESQAAVTYTEARTLNIDAPNFLKKSLGEVFGDIFEEKTTVEVKPKNKDIERMLIGMFTGEFVREMPEDIIAQLPCDEKAKAALSKKLKGQKFETDRDNLMKIGGFSEADAGDYAYLYAEAVIYRTFKNVCDMSDTTEAQLVRSFDLSLSVSDSTKIAVT